MYHVYIIYIKSSLIFYIQDSVKLKHPAMVSWCHLFTYLTCKVHIMMKPLKVYNALSNKVSEKESLGIKLCCVIHLTVDPLTVNKYYIFNLLYMIVTHYNN